MRTPDWRAESAPTGPKATIRCSCGEHLLAMDGERRITRDTSVEPTAVECGKCGRTAQLRITGGANDATSD